MKEKEDRSNVKALLAAAPKRPATPYLVYFTEFWSTNKGTYKTAEGNYKNTAGGTTLTEAVKDASAKWLVMSEAEQAKYREAASDAAAKYARDYRRFYESLTPENLKLIAKVQGKEPAPPGGRRAAKLELRNRPGNPGKPSGAYFMFLKDKRAEIEAANPNWTGNERMLKLSRAAGDMWRNLPQADKDVSLSRAMKLVVVLGPFWLSGLPFVCIGNTHGQRADTSAWAQHVLGAVGGTASTDFKHLCDR